MAQHKLSVNNPCLWMTDDSECTIILIIIPSWKTALVPTGKLESEL